MLVIPVPGGRNRRSKQASPMSEIPRPMGHPTSKSKIDGLHTYVNTHIHTQLYIYTEKKKELSYICI